MHPARRSTEAWAAREAHGLGDRGSAALEFILVGVLLLVPLVYLIVALGAIQEHALGVEAGARHIARVMSSAPDLPSARAQADRVSRAVAEEYGIAAGSLQVSVHCRPAGGGCPQAGATLEVTVATTVPLPLVPPVLGLDRAARVPVEAFAVQKVSRLWGTG